MRSSRPRTVLALPRFPWLSLASGKLGSTRFIAFRTDSVSSFAEKILQAVRGESNITEPTFVYLPGLEGGDAIAKQTGTEFFAAPVELGVSCPPVPFSSPRR